MPTYHQLIKSPRKSPEHKSKTPLLKGKPQIKGVCLKVLVMKPKKPNSALRKICKVQLTTGKRTRVYIPGIGHNIQQHNVLLIRGGRTQDLPGLKYKVVRGVYDGTSVNNRRRSRSKYGVSKPKI
jgi:small subunit ribosomal protein S12